MNSKSQSANSRRNSYSLTPTPKVLEATNNSTQRLLSGEGKKYSMNLTPDFKVPQRRQSKLSFLSDGEQAFETIRRNSFRAITPERCNTGLESNEELVLFKLTGPVQVTCFERQSRDTSIFTKTFVIEAN